VQKMVLKGRETILGMTRDPHFGPLLMFGLGGTFVEVFQDVMFQLAPISEDWALKMIQGLKGSASCRASGANPRRTWRPSWHPWSASPRWCWILPN